MKKIIVLFSLLISVIYSCKNNKQIVSPASDMLKTENDFLATIDSNFKEPDLSKGYDSTSEIYRVWKLSADEYDTSSIITIEKKLNEIILTKKCFIYKHSIPISTDSVFYSKKRLFTLEDWRLFKDKIYNSYFWNLTNTNDDDNIIDCNTYIFEGARYSEKKNKKYNVFVAECPQGSLHEVYNCLWSLSKMP